MKRSNPNRLHFILFLVLSVVAIAQLSWWVIFQVQEGGRITSLQQEIWRQQIRTATMHFEMADIAAKDKSSWLIANFPDIRLKEDGSGLTITEEARKRLDELAGKRVRMFVSEGAFFSLLVLAGIWFFYWALRKRIELENKTAAILGAAHAGMRDPLSIIERDIAALKESGKTDPIQKNSLSEISSNIRKISDICENVSLIQMLAISKRKMDIIVTDISESTGSLVSEYKSSLSRSGSQIESKIEDSLTAVTNPDQWTKVALGTLRVAENNTTRKGTIALQLERHGGLAVLRVRFSPDLTGNTMDENLEKVESELGIITELAETIGVKVEVIPEGDSMLTLKAEISLLEE